MSLVVAISGVSGSGKSTLVKKIGAQLGQAATLHFDDYREVSSYPTDVEQWLTAGGDPDRWETPQFCLDLHTLRQGNSIFLPNEQRSVEPAPVILVEEPFGRARKAMAALVDLVIFVDVPLELALARKLLQYIEHLERNPAENPLLLLRHYVAKYPSNRKLYQFVMQRVALNCDLRVDGTQPIDQVVNTIIPLVIEKAETDAKCL